MCISIELLVSSRETRGHVNVYFYWTACVVKRNKRSCKCVFLTSCFSWWHKQFNRNTHLHVTSCFSWWHKQFNRNTDLHVTSCFSWRHKQFNRNTHLHVTSCFSWWHKQFNRNTDLHDLLFLLTTQAVQ
jgi:hypothetical protein